MWIENGALIRGVEVILCSKLIQIGFLGFCFFYYHNILPKIIYLRQNTNDFTLF